jgi:transcriptional regulator with XRE-family HTH domain
MKTRISKLIASEQLTSSKFADIIGVQRSSISHLLAGRNNPSLDFIQKVISNFSDLSVEWLITGKGEMYKSEKKTSLFDTTQPIAPPPTPQPTIDVKTEETETTVLETHQEQKPPKTNSVPIPPSGENKEVEKVIIFYSDKSFRAYSPSD